MAGDIEVYLAILELREKIARKLADDTLSGEGREAVLDVAQTLDEAEDRFRLFYPPEG